MEVVGTPEVPTEKKKFPRAKAGWLKGSGTPYNPDADVFKDFEVSTEEYVKRFTGKREYTPKNSTTKESFVPGVDFTLQSPVLFREGGRFHYRWRPLRIQGMPDYLKYLESGTGRAKRSLEESGNAFEFDSGGFGGGFEFSSTHGSADRLFQNDSIPFIQGPFNKQLYWSDYLAMHSRAFQLVNHAALAAGAVKIMTRFVLGRGVSFSIKNDQAKAIWDEFWEMNHMRHKVRQMARDLCWQGELMLRFYEREPGKTSMRILDPSTCWEVVTDPEDFEHVYYYHFQWPTPYQVWTQGNIPISKYIIQQVPPTNIQHIKINISSQEKRGRSDLLPAFPWLKRFDDYYNGAIMKAILEANLVYKIKVHGDQNDLDSMSSDPNFTLMPPPGGTWLENDAVDMTPLSAMMTAGRGSSGIGQQIASIVATSLNLPTEYFNIEGGAGGARATALVRTDPAVKAVEDRQQILRESLEDLYDRVMEAALREGRIDRAAIRRDAMVVPDDGQVDDEMNPDKSLPFGGTSHSLQPVQATPVNRNQSFPGRPVKASIRG